MLLSLFRDRQAAPHIRTGRRGERTAVRFLHRHGYRVIGRNIRVGRRDEIDILAWDPEDRVLVFAEVKSRERNDDDYHPLLNATVEKRAALARSARRWVAMHEYPGGYRIDLLCVAGGEVTEHVVNL